MESQLDRFCDEDEKVENADGLEVDELEGNDDDETLGDARAGDGNVSN
jgi:hypothetical protein